MIKYLLLIKASEAPYNHLKTQLTESTLSVFSSTGVEGFFEPPLLDLGGPPGLALGWNNPYYSWFQCFL